jgi:hypothetical protein
VAKPSRRLRRHRRRAALRAGWPHRDPRPPADPSRVGLCLLCGPSRGPLQLWSAHPAGRPPVAFAICRACWTAAGGSNAAVAAEIERQVIAVQVACN